MSLTEHSKTCAHLLYSKKETQANFTHFLFHAKRVRRPKGKATFRSTLPGVSLGCKAVGAEVNESAACDGRRFISPEEHALTPLALASQRSTKPKALKGNTTHVNVSISKDSKKAMTAIAPSEQLPPF